MLEKVANEYVAELFRTEYPWAIKQNGDHAIVEFSETNLEEAFAAGFIKAFDWLAEPGEAAIIAGFEEYPAIWTAAITDEDRVGIWTAMLAAKRKEALG